jgi:hypothetical protein
VDLITVRRFERANNNLKSGRVASVKAEVEHDSFSHARLLSARGTGVSSPGERKSFRNLLTFVHI